MLRNPEIIFEIFNKNCYSEASEMVATAELILKRSPRAVDTGDKNGQKTEPQPPGQPLAKTTSSAKDVCVSLLLLVISAANFL